jgi:metallo-beta-lactamase family protein
MKLTFYGAVRNVTGSNYLLEAAGGQILLECGLYQGRRRDTYEKNLHFPYNPAAMDTLILSHAHLDHIGNLPNLVKRGFHGRIHCTPPTADLARLLLLDAAELLENDAGYVNKVRARHNEPPVPPLFTVADVPPALALLQTHEHNHWFIVAPQVEGIFRYAGHILGSAITVLKMNEKGRNLSLCFTGDLGRKNLPIINDPYIVDDADVLIIESTYGERLHRDISQIETHLANVINEALARHGKIIVPSFAVERAQELIYLLHRLRLARKIPSFPIYVDSPLATEATDVFRRHTECFDPELKDFTRTVDDPFGFGDLTYVRSTEESKALNTRDGPLMIIAGSGMAEGGRILHHLKNNIEDPRNTILIVGWQAENTLGRKIADRWDQVPIFGTIYAPRSRYLTNSVPMPTGVTS